MLSLQGEAEAHGAMVAFGTRVTAIVPHPQGLALSVNGEEAPSIVAHTVINAAGLAPEFRPRTRLKLLDTERKEFFVEKKNQKTFMSGVDVAGKSRDSEAKVFPVYQPIGPPCMEPMFCICSYH